MNASYCFAGSDVCKDFLDVHLLPSKLAERFPNTAAGHRALIDLLKSKHVRLIVLEATGGYEHAAVVALVCAGLRVHVAQPQVVRSFAKSLKLRAKNDDLDAAVCARYAQDRCDDLELAVVDKTHDALRDLVSHRNDQVVRRSASKNRLKQAESQGRNRFVVRALKRDIAFYTKEIARTEKELAAAVSTAQAVTVIGDATLTDTAVVHAGTVTPTGYLTYLSGSNFTTGTADGTGYTIATQLNFDDILDEVMRALSPGAHEILRQQADQLAGRRGALRIGLERQAEAAPHLRRTDAGAERAVHGVHDGGVQEPCDQAVLRADDRARRAAQVRDDGVHPAIAGAHERVGPPAAGIAEPGQMHVPGSPDLGSVRQGIQITPA